MYLDALSPEILSSYLSKKSVKLFLDGIARLEVEA